MTHRSRLLVTLLGLALVGCQAPLATLRVSAASTPAPTTPHPVWGLAPQAAAVGGPTSPTVVPDQLIVDLEPGQAVADWMASPAADGFTLRGSLRLGQRYLIKLGLPTAGEREAARRQLASAPGVRRVSEDPIPRPVAFTFTQADARLSEQWAHEERFANTLNAWDKVAVADQSKIIVAVLDTGLDTAHPEFTGRIEGPANFTVANPDPDNPDADVTDNQGHGTHVTGIVGATGNNNVGVAGVAWGVKLMPVKVLGDAGTGGTFDIIQGITYATAYEAADGARVRVINMSLGTPSGGIDAYYAEAVAAARAAGILVVAATGNDGRGVVGQPATTPHALAVGATAHYLAWERLAAFSNYGERLDLVAPGEEILSTLPGVVTGFGKDYGVVSGTSMAAPYVAGVAALVMAKYDKTNASRTAAFVDKVRARLIAACDDLGAPGRDPIYGAGRLNAARAVTPGTIDAAP